MLDSYRDLIDGLLESPTAVRDILGDPLPEGLTPERLALLADLRVREAVMLRRAQLMMREAPHTSRPALRAIEQEPELRNPAPATERVDELYAGFSQDRSELVSILMNVTIREWEQQFDHHGKGETTLAEEIDDHLVWDEELIARLRTTA